MVRVWQILTVTLVAVGMALSLAHALELPGKRRLPREVYLAVQSIYYPGFTIAGGFGEFGAMLATLVLLVVTPFRTPEFWLVLGALLGLLIMHAVYWTVTHPVNKVWLKDQALGTSGAAFFAVGGRPRPGRSDDEWTALRDRWEYSHVVRAALAMASLLALFTAVTR